MNRKFSFAVLLAMLMGLMSSTYVNAQSYTVSPTGYTSVPSSNVTHGSRTLHGNLLQVKATVSGSTATFTLKKNDGSKFKNGGSIFVRKDTYSGSNVQSSVQYSADIYYPTVDVDLDFTSGSKTYVIVISSKGSNETYYYYSNPITITASSTLATPDYTQFTYSNVTSTGFRAKWASVSGATKYNILVKKASDTNYNNPVFEASNLTTTYCDVTGLQPNTAYQFQIQAANSTGKSSWSKSIQTSITTLSEYTLDTPDYNQFSYSNVTSSGFRAKWASVSRATKYNILVKKASDTNYNNPVFEKYNLTTTYCDVTGLQPNTAYQFQIQAINSTEKSSWSKSIQTSITTLGEYTLDTPDYTQFTYSNVTSTGFRAKWASVSGATKYNILVKKASDSNYNNPVFEENNLTTTYCDVTGLQPNTSYQFQIQAVNSTGKSSWSKSIQTSITTLGEYTLNTPDYTQFTYSNVTSTGFRAKWASVSGATKYNILVKKASDTNYNNPVFEANDLTTTYCDVTGLQPNTAYQFQVQAANSTGKSSWSKSIQSSVTTNSASSGSSDYTVSPSGYTSVPTTDVTHGSRTLLGNVLQAKATVSGSIATFTLKKSDGSKFQNGGSIFVRQDSYSGSNVQSSVQYSAEIYYPTVDVNLDFTSGSKTYVIVISSKGSNDTYYYYTNPITIKASTSSSLDTPDKTTFKATNITETGFTASWGSVQGADCYDIYVKRASDADYTNPVFKRATSRTYINVTDLNPGTSYQFQIRARNSVTKQSSSWSPSIPTAVKTANVESGSEPVNLSIHKNKSFDGKTSLYVGKTEHYYVYVLNNGSSTWKGSFILKEGNTGIKKWDDISLPSGWAQPLEYDYTPESKGTKTLTLYYQTKGESSINSVKAGVSSSNPMTVAIISNSSVNNGLKLKETISCPTTIELGKNSVISGVVKNDNSSNWSGSISICVDGKELNSKSVTLGYNGETPISTTWKPETAGKHYVGIYYRSDNGNTTQLVSGNDFNNPVAVIVSNADVLSDASKVIIKHLTKTVVPSEVTPGSNVYYHFRLLDENGRQLRGIKLQFKLAGSDRIVESEPSDVEGYTVLSLVTSGSEAIAGRGVTAKLRCSSAINEAGKVLSVDGGADDRQISLTVHKGNTFSEGSGTENVEKAELTLEVGASAKADWKLAKIKAGGNLGINTKLGIKFDDNGGIKEYSIDGGLKGGISGSLGEKSSNPLTELGIDGSIGESMLSLDAIKGGVQANVRWGTTTTDPLDLIVRLIMSYVDNYTEGTSKLQDMAVKAMRHWYADKRKDDFEWSWSITGSAGVSGKILSCWPAKNIARPLMMPIVRYTDLGITGEGSFTIEPQIEKTSWNSSYEGDDLSSISKEHLSGSSSTLKLKGEFDAKLEIGKIWNDTKSWWAINKMHQFHKNKLGETFPSVGYSYDKTCSLKHEELYNDSQSLREVSQSFSISSGWEVSANKIQLSDWGPGDYTFGISNKTTSKLSSKGDWATFLARVSVPDGSDSYLTQLLQGFGISTKNKDNYRQQVFKVFPNLARNTLICSPAEIYNAWKGDFDKPLSILADITPNPQDYELKEALKLEEKVTSEMDFNASIKVYDWKVAKFYIDAGMTFGIDNRPSNVSYFSLPDRRFFTVVQRPTTNIEQTAGWMVDFTEQKISDAFEKCKDEILKAWDWLKDTYHYVVDESSKIFDNAVGDWIEDHILFPIAYHNLMKDRNSANARHAMSRHPQLEEMEQVDICRFSVGINNEEVNFDSGVKLEIPHYYPAGDLFGVTDQGDTIFVVSEVCNLIAIQGNDTLRTTQYGQFSLEGIIGVDDLIPFGFSEDLPLDVYYSEEGSDIWHYVGPAGTKLMTNRLGSYMMGTSIKNDMIKPEINADFDEQTGIIHINVNENIGLRLNTLNVLLNGEAKEFTVINETNFEVNLTAEDLQYMLNLNVMVYDLAGNLGTLSQAFQLDKPEKINIENLPDTDISQLENTIYIGNVSAEKGKDMTLSVKMKNSVVAEGFQFDLELPEGITVAKDADGFAEAYLSTERTTARKTNTFDADFQDNGALRVMAGSTNGSTISGNDGEVAIIKLNVASDVKEGTYPIVLRNISISDSNAKSYDVDLVKSTLTVTGVLGDVDGDGYVTKADVTALADYIMGRNPESFNYNNANINGDFNVDVADLVLLLNMVK